MEDDKKEDNHDGCTRCRWMELIPLPYGLVEYFCVNRQDTIPSGELAKRRCRKFEA